MCLCRRSAGWLIKQSDVIKRWQKRWFVLANGALARADTENGSTREVSVVGGAVSVCDAEKHGKPYTFELVSPSMKRPLVMAASSEQERTDWVQAIRQHVLFARKQRSQRHTISTSPTGLVVYVTHAETKLSHPKRYTVSSECRRDGLRLACLCDSLVRVAARRSTT